MVAKKLMGTCATAMLVVIAAACGHTGTGGESQPAGQPQEDVGAPRSPGSAPERREQPQMDYASAAATFGVAGEEIRAAPGEPGQGRKTVADAAATLGVPEEAFRVSEGTTGSGVPPRSLHRGRTSGACRSSMTAVSGAAGRPDGRPDVREPDQERGRALTGISGLHLLHLTPVETVVADDPSKPARELLATISDRIRNPLQVLLARADLMDDEETAGRIREQVRRINDAVKYLEGALSDPYSTEKKGGPALDEDIHRR